jgi:hypothetical protein
LQPHRISLVAGSGKQTCRVVAQGSVCVTARRAHLEAVQLIRAPVWSQGRVRRVDTRSGSGSSGRIISKERPLGRVGVLRKAGRAVRVFRRTGSEYASSGRRGFTDGCREVVMRCVCAVVLCVLCVLCVRACL